MKMTIAAVSKPIVLSLCISAWALAGNAHAASSHFYPAVGCQEAYPYEVVGRYNGALESDHDNQADVACPIVTDANSTQITVTVFYEAELYAPPTYVGKVLVFSCSLESYDPATKANHYDNQSVHPIVRNGQNVGGSFRLSMEASRQFNILYCVVPGTAVQLHFRVLGYQVDES